MLLLTKVGDTISANLTPSNASNVASYQWYSNGNAITGATSATYKVQESDLGTKLSVKVTDTEGNVFSSEESAAVTQAALLCLTYLSITYGDNLINALWTMHRMDNGDYIVMFGFRWLSFL